MAETVFRGPSVVAGALMDGRVEPMDGLSVQYQGDLVADPRFFPMAKDGLGPGRIPGWYNTWNVVTVDNVPSATASNILVTAATPSITTGALFTLRTGLNGVSQLNGTVNGPVTCANIPIIPTNTTVVQNVMAIDFGFTVGTTAANSSTVLVPDNRIFQLGQWLVIAGAGDSAGNSNTALITQVVGISSTATTSINISPVAVTAIANAPIGQGNLFSNLLPGATPFGPSVASANAAVPYRVAGLGLAFDPAQAVTRNLTITSLTAGITGTGIVLISGYDVYGNPMTETLQATGTSAATGAAGKKAWKYISSIAVQAAFTSGAGGTTVSIGLGNAIGFGLRTDKWEYTDAFLNAGFMLNATGWTASVTSSATLTSGDVRGCVNYSTALATAANGPIPGGTRVTLFQTVPLVNAILATPTNYTSLLGVAQFTGTS